MNKQKKSSIEDLIKSKLTLKDDIKFSQFLQSLGNQLRRKFKQCQGKSLFQHNFSITSNNQYEQMNLKSFFSKIKKMRFCRFQIKNCFNFQFHDVQHIQFQNLCYVNLQGNHLISIEPLQSMNLQSLSKLNLGYNYISNVTALRKLNCRDIVEIHLQQNIVTEHGKVSQFDAIRLKDFDLQNDLVEVSLLTIDWLYCLQSNKIVHLAIYPFLTYSQSFAIKTRISTIPCLKQKFPDLAKLQ